MIVKLVLMDILIRQAYVSLVVQIVENVMLILPLGCVIVIPVILIMMRIMVYVSVV